MFVAEEGSTVSVTVTVISGACDTMLTASESKPARSLLVEVIADSDWLAVVQGLLGDEADAEALSAPTKCLKKSLVPLRDSAVAVALAVGAEDRLVDEREAEGVEVTEE
jgi:hypothetical protein